MMGKHKHMAFKMADRLSALHVSLALEEQVWICVRQELASQNRGNPGIQSLVQRTRQLINASVIVKNNSQNLLSVDCRPTVGHLSADCWPTVGRQSTDSRPTVDRLSADCRPTSWPLFKLITYEMRRWCVGGVLVTRLGLMELLQC